MSIEYNLKYNAAQISGLVRSPGLIAEAGSFPRNPRFSTVGCWAGGFDLSLEVFHLHKHHNVLGGIIEKIN